MNSSTRWLLSGLVVALFVFLGVSCGNGKPPSGCDSVSCASGCCDSTGVCQAGTSSAFCGTGAKACVACSGTQVCSAGACGTSSGGGSGGTGGSGGSGGGTAGGSGGTGGTGGTGGSGGGPTDGGLTAEQIALLTARPYRTVVPGSYDGGQAIPMVVLLHGYTATGLEQDLYFGFTALANAKGFLLATPDGTTELAGTHFWNATNACCNFFGSTVDDVKYLTAILDQSALKYRIDPKRVYFVGHSNGGFMAHRMACDRSGRVAAIVSLAGAQWKDVSNCQPTAPVSVLEVHGTFDLVINYDGGVVSYDGGVGNTFPGAKETVQDWSTLNGCTGQLTTYGGTLDLDAYIFGSETVRAKYNCTNGAAELWTIQGGSHVPGLGFPSTWGDSVWSFLSSHPKP